MTTKEKTVTTKAPTLEQLEQAEAEAMARVAQARDAADEMRRQAEQRREDAVQAHDETVLRDWQDTRKALENDLTAARSQLREAVMADPVWSAYRDLVLAGHRLATNALDVSNSIARVRGPEAPRPDIPSYSAPPWGELLRIVQGDAEAQGRDEAAAREQACEDAGTAAYGEV